MIKKTKLSLSIIFKPVIFLIFLFTLPGLSIAQNEIDRMRISLQGLQEMGFSANIEGNARITEMKELSPGAIRDAAGDFFEGAGIRLVDDREVESSADIPLLHIHINTMELDNGLVPFAIQLKLYQPVRLILNRGLQTSASTWDTGMVGIVSRDQIPVIRQAAENMVDEFINDYNAANRR
jgi:hypothetical protein